MAQAQDYNRVGVSYDHSNLGFNRNMDILDRGSETVGDNGFALNYTHGFGVAQNMFVEVGGNIDFLFGSKSISEYDEKLTYKHQNINLQVPVNYVYRFNITDGVSIDPYVGLNFKLHFANKFKLEYSDEDGTESSDWISVYDKDKMGKDDTWNRFQMGWHIGVGLNYEKYYLGVQFGTDFIPAYSETIDGDKYKVNTADVKITLGYTF